MNKADLVNSVAKATGQTKLNVHNTVAALLHALTSSLAKGERVTLVGFGTFERRHRQARYGVNPQNPKQKLKIDAAKVPVFRAGQELKDVVDGRSKQAPLPKAVSAHDEKPKAKKAGAKPVKKAAKTKPAKKAPAKKKPVAKKKKR
jgi:DNA-binding protein HU-beta